MKQPRKRHSASFKCKVALEAIKEQKTLNELSSEYGIQSAQISQWKSHLKERGHELFESSRDKKSQDQKGQDQSELIDELYRQIGQLKVELDWIKRKADS